MKNKIVDHISKETTKETIKEILADIFLGWIKEVKKETNNE